MASLEREEITSLVDGSGRLCPVIARPDAYKVKFRQVPQPGWRGGPGAISV